MRFTADPDGEAAAGARLADLADALTGVDVSTDLNVLAGALPGTRVAIAVPDVAAAWAARLAALRTALGDHARGLVTGARWYAATEESVSRSVGGAAGGPSGPTGGKS